MKKILVVGSSGYVGNYMMKTLARRYPQVAVVGMSRSAQPREEETARLPNVSYVKGDALEPESFKQYLQDVDGVVHCVGTLIEKKNNPKLTYNAMNRDTVINVAAELQEIAEAKGENRTFVLISSEKAPPFLDAYLTSKIEAEDYLFKECPNLKSTAIRPGFIWDPSHRWWSIPRHYGVDIAWWMNENIARQLPFSSYYDFLFPAKSIRLSTLAHFVDQGVTGSLGDTKVVRNEALIQYEAENPQK